MDAPVTEEQIRTLAYRLWEEAGSPEGRSEAFWAQALKQLGIQGDGSDDTRMTDSLPNVAPIQNE
ncbi:hypothetical protein AWB74_08199 [Caballeronia arvi]|uniref:DUF2934 domain-containing protein n=1 Tax=Caballeronia arvi TaxID=1777135 RepID=A0A158L3N8_9BURK|nr:DUF2934 domain-containing protein [Caballeronia arvi]SAL87639.1 hypothetical protein AWB74_08199 [Caballeronia arvi]